MKKYRPVLTREQISHLIHLCKTDLSNLSMECIAKLAPFLAKVDNLGVQEAYTQKPPKSKLDDLGFASDSENQGESKQDMRKRIYDQYVLLGEDISQFSVTQIQQIQLHRYENNLMSPEEESEYEQSQFTSLFTP